MEELEESDDLTPQEFYAALKKHLPADLLRKAALPDGKTA